MNSHTRREFLQGGVAATAWLAGAARARAAAAPLRVAPRDSASIAASPFSVGFETLDRRMFDPERTYPHLAKLGAKWARVHTGWCRTETKPGEYDFAWLDAVVDRLRGIGIQPWFCVGFGNRLYTPQADHETAVGWVPTGTPGGRAAWLRYVGALAAHYRGRVRHFEIWNEPNGTSFWKPNPPDPAGYAGLVELTAPAIRRAVDDAVLIGGAIAGMDTKFFEACMEHGLGRHIHKVSFHSYRPFPEKDFAADIANWRRILAKHAPGLPLWHGEVGAASQPGGAGGRANYPWTEPRQAKWLLRRFVSDLREGIELVSCFHTVDLVNYFGSDGPTNKTNYKGLLRGTDYTPKPGYFAVQCLCALLDADTTRADLAAAVSPAAGAAEVKPEEIVHAGFARKGCALHAVWHPPGMDFERADGRIRLEIATGPGAAIEDPVVVDPLTSEVHPLPGATRSGDRWAIPDARLADHPLFFTDRAAVRPA